MRAKQMPSVETLERRKVFSANPLSEAMLPEPSLAAYQATPELDANGNAFAPLKPAEWTTDVAQRGLILMPDPAICSRANAHATDQVMSQWIDRSDVG